MLKACYVSVSSSWKYIARLQKLKFAEVEVNTIYRVVRESSPTNLWNLWEFTSFGNRSLLQ